MEKPEEGRNRVAVENVQPEIDGGRFPIKRVIGEQVVVEADVFADGHDQVRAQLLWKAAGEENWHVEVMASIGNDRWRAQFRVDQLGGYVYTVAGEIDHFKTWRDDLVKRSNAAQDLHMAFQTGAGLVRSLRAAAEDAEGRKLAECERALERAGQPKATAAEAGTALRLVLSDEVSRAMSHLPAGADQTSLGRSLPVAVDRERAGFSAWYELFPRSWSPTPGRPGTLRDVAAGLDYVADMGFDILYLPPIHPIGQSFRKGKNNVERAAPGDVGSPWAIGSSEGGHTAIDPALGTFEDFEYLLETAHSRGLEVALDIAFQCSPDHPWVKQHPEFFRKRPDGSIQYAENPPKKYQDIYPLDFESNAWRELWDALREVFFFWIEKGVRIFRVDNPHTKTFPFWEWVIGEIRTAHPDVILLAEAFTRPRLMQRLAKLGFSQSYTYFTWRNSKEELAEYMRELTETSMREYFRPNFWPNTPDILHATLQRGGLPAFKSRFVLASTLAANYGIYGPAFELGENQPAAEGSEEYLNSEKYEIKNWNLDSPASLRPLITRVNRARHENSALSSNRRLHFHSIDNPLLLCYSKRSEDGTNVVLVVVSLDPDYTQSGWVDLDLPELGLDWDEAFAVEDLLTDRRYLWQGSRNYVELRPQEIPAHLFRITVSKPGRTP